MSRKGPSAESAYRAGRPALGVLRETLTVMGTAWSEWTPLASLDGRIEHHVRRICQSRGLEGVPVASVVARVRRVVLACWLPYRSHYRLGSKRHAWRDPEEEPMDVREAELDLEVRKAVFSQWGVEGRMKQRVREFEDKQRVLARARVGMDPQTIADQMGNVHLNTVRRWMREAGLARPRGAGSHRKWDP